MSFDQKAKDNSFSFGNQILNPHENILNSKLSNLAEPSFSNDDRDDSLYDALSFDAQTPFKSETQDHLKLTQNNLNSFRDSINDQETNRYSLIDLEFIKNANFKDDHTDLMLDLKDTSIDEILLIADDTQTARNFNLSNIKQQSPSKIPVPNKNNLNKSNLNRYQSIESFHELEQLQKNVKQFDKASSPKRKETNEKTKLQMLKEKINSINLNDKRKKDEGFEIIKTPQPDLIDENFLIPTDGTGESKNEGAFKLYSSEKNDLKNSKENTKKSNPTVKKPLNNQSPFYSIDKQSANSNRGPTKKYRSGSTNNLDKNNSKNQGNKNLSSKPNSERIRPSTQNEITYSLDSDESTIIDNLIKDPDRLKKKLKQSKLEREQLNQLQQNYTRLLQQYAEAENFIDAFRVNGQLYTNSTNPTPVVKGSLPANDSKSQINACFQPNYTQPSFYSSTATLSSNQQLGNNDKTNSLNGSKTVLITEQQNPFVNKQTISLVKSQSNENLNQNKEFLFQSQSTNNFQPIDNLNKNKSQSAVYVIPNKIRSNSESKSPTIDETSCQNKTPPIDEENIIIDQTSTLGILVQIKVLEDKMQSFMTLVNEKQLNKFEQRQVYESIQNDYKTLIHNYNDVKAVNTDALKQEQIEMDVDLNKELGKMRTLLDDIVHKMSDNLIDELSECSEESEKQSLENSSVASFFDNQDEIRDQYNRLLDVFKEEKQNSSDNSTNKGKTATNTKQIEKKENVEAPNKNLHERESKEMPQKIIKQGNKTIGKNYSNEQSESISEYNNQIMKNNIKILNSRKSNENTNHLNKKLSRISVDRVEEYDNEDTFKENPNEKIIRKNANLERLNRNIQNNRRLTKMSNESSTSTLNTSESESTQMDFYDKNAKPSFQNYIDEFDDETLNQTPKLQHNKKPVIKNEIRKNEILKIKSSDEARQRNHKEQRAHKNIISDLGTSDQETSEQDVTIRRQEPIEKSKQTKMLNPQKKSVSIGNIYQQSQDKRQKDYKTDSRENFKNSKKNMRSIPVAKAYEGSDSLEDIDQSINIVNKEPKEYASTIIVKEENLKKYHQEKRPEFYHKNHKTSQNELRRDKLIKHPQQSKLIKNNDKEKNDQKIRSVNRRESEIEDESIMLNTDIDSIIEKKRTLKNSKRDLMQKLAEEVEYLKQEILKKNKEKSTTPECANEKKRKNKRSEFINSDPRENVFDSQHKESSKNILLKNEVENEKPKRTEEFTEHKNPPGDKVIIQNNKKILVVKNEFGKQQYFCLIEDNPNTRNGKTRKENRKTDFSESFWSDSSKNENKIISKNSKKTKEKSKYYSVSNLNEITKIKKHDPDDYFSDEEIECQVYDEPKLFTNRNRIYSSKDRRYQSTNDIFDSKSLNTMSLNGFSRNLPMHRSQKIIYQENNPVSLGYPVPIVKESSKNRRQVPLVIGKNFKKSNRFSSNSECLIFLPVNNTDLIKNVPINLIPYPINEVSQTQDLEKNFDNSIRNIINPKSLIGKNYGSAQHINQVIGEKFSSPIVNDELNESAQEKKSRRVRYYIREYADVSTVSDNEMIFGSDDCKDIFKMNESNSIDLDMLIDQAMTYAYCITSNARRIRKKLCATTC
ncbi:unnamed protein product [Brachionus calyciflorus]|uniref:Uncharacterized protein n=1 Tax=Brachionus calyciflorus TaxID=104777 RepID=A0A813MK49_9BILA|nr:unnamed protein product [Brachionus calyciflorus]